MLQDEDEEKEESSERQSGESRLLRQSTRVQSGVRKSVCLQGMPLYCLSARLQLWRMGFDALMPA